MRKILLLVGVFICTIFLASCSVEEAPDDTNISEENSVLIDKTKNMCEVDSDCEYIWYTGGCKTPESVAGVMDKCRDGSGPCPSESMRRENVTCSCENNTCITHG